MFPPASFAVTVNVKFCTPVDETGGDVDVGVTTSVVTTPPIVTGTGVAFGFVASIGPRRPVASGVPVPSVDAYERICTTTDVAYGTVA